MVTPPRPPPKKKTKPSCTLVVKWGENLGEQVSAEVSPGTGESQQHHYLKAKRNFGEGGSVVAEGSTSRPQGMEILGYSEGGWVRGGVFAGPGSWAVSALENTGS